MMPVNTRLPSRYKGRLLLYKISLCPTLFTYQVKFHIIKSVNSMTSIKSRSNFSAKSRSDSLNSVTKKKSAFTREESD